MNKKIMMAVLCVVMAVALSGCGGPGNPIPWDDAAERANLVHAASSWAGGIEDYDIDAMAGNNILAAGFVLTITENSRTYTKSYEKLLAELQADAANQANYRDDSAYALRLDIDDGVAAGDLLPGYDTVNAWTIVNISLSGADVVAFFEVFEEAAGTPRWRTDTGQISMHFVRTFGAWKIRNMDISFGADAYADGAGAGAVATARAVARPRTTGFGF